MAEDLKNPFPLPLTVFICVKYSAEHALKLKRVQEATRPPNDRHS